jgi:endonuclease YncB( thermonuclease family)
MSRQRRRRRYFPAPARPKWRIALDALTVIGLTGLILYSLDLVPGGNFSGNMIAVDGDSLRPKAGAEDIRLHGIDAPELNQSCQDARGQTYPCGRRSRDHLRKLIGGQDVTCRTVDVDRYGRTVAVCTAGESELNRQMVADGWALAYRQHEHRYVRDEVAAQGARRGIWQGTFERPELWRRINLGDAAGE